MKERLPANLKTAQFRSLLGREPLFPDRIIITPLKSVYSQLADTLADVALLSETKGFYQNAHLRTFGGELSNLGGGLIVCTPQGFQVQDILWVLPKCAVLFIGFAGSPYSKLEIGSIVEVTETLDEEGQVYQLKTTGLYPGIRCGSSPCLLGTRAEECCRRGLEWNCWAVEMETAALAAAARKNGQQMTAWLLITDAPGAVNFWEVDESQQQSINIAQRELTITAANWINGGII